MKNKDYIISKIYLSEIQNAAKANIGRMLTNTEVKRLHYYRYDDPFIFGIYDTLINVAEQVSKEETNFSSIDNEYKESNLGSLFPDDCEDEW